MKSRAQKSVIFVVAVICAVAVAVGILLVYKSSPPDSFAELVSLKDDDLKAVDIARMNLLCAQGLPGSQEMGIEAARTLFDQWAELVQQNEKKYSAQFFQDRQSYDNSYSKFQAVNLGLTLKQDLKCGYNKALVGPGIMRDVQSTRFFRDSRDLFLHGFIESRTGSCSSLPVLMVAVGRRAVIHSILWPARGICSAGGTTGRSSLILKRPVKELIANPIRTTSAGPIPPQIRKSAKKNISRT